MKFSYVDAVLPLATAVAVAIKPNRVRPICTASTIMLGSMTADHLRGRDPQARFTGIYLGATDLPQLSKPQRDVVNAALNGALLGTAFVGPVAAARLLPQSMAPAAGALMMLGAQLGVAIVGDQGAQVAARQATRAATTARDAAS